MELNGELLKINQINYDGVIAVGMWPGHESYTSTYDVYTVTRDMASGTVISSELTDRVEENIYGLLENSAGELVGPTPIVQSAYYYGGHVILNGTMMRSYALTGSTFQHFYWIKAEDLENYGYTLIFAGELGEYSIETLDDNYYAMRVTTP